MRKPLTAAAALSICLLSTAPAFAAGKPVFKPVFHQSVAQACLTDQGSRGIVVADGYCVSLQELREVTVSDTLGDSEPRRFLENCDAGFGPSSGYVTEDGRCLPKGTPEDLSL